MLIPEARVAFLGDLFWHTSLPNTIDATISAWIETLNRFSTDYANYTFVSGHGAIGTASDVGAFRDYLVTLMKNVQESRSRLSAAPAGAVVEGMPSFAKYSQWGNFRGFLGPNLRDAEAESAGTKKNPQPVAR